MEQIVAACEGVQWGTVGEWVGGLSALAAVLVALSIAFRERTDRQSAEARATAAEARATALEEAAAKEKREAQARAVAAWIYHRDGTAEDERDAEGLPPLAVRMLAVVNGSSQPIFDVKVQYWEKGPNGAQRTEIFDLPAMGPDSRERIRPRGTIRYEGEAVIQFTDASDQRWERRERGELRPVSEAQVWA
jgi:hypothetical protein